MASASGLQPDQQPDRWDGHVLVYEKVFEPFALTFAKTAIESLGSISGARVIDVAAGAGGAALQLAGRGASVVAVDAAPMMVARCRERARAKGLHVDAQVMDGTKLGFPSASFDAGLSIFGIILFPDAVAGLRELVRVVRPGGLVALATWTEPQSYELVTGLRKSAEEMLGPLPLGNLPAQLRFTDPSQFKALFHAAGLSSVEIRTVRSELRAPSAAWLVERLAFAPGMEALLASFGNERAKVLSHYRDSLESQFANGEIVLQGKAAVGVAMV